MTTTPKMTTKVSSPSGVVTTIVEVTASPPSGVVMAAPPPILSGLLVSYPSGHVMTGPLEKTVGISPPSGTGTMLTVSVVSSPSGDVTVSLQHLGGTSVHPPSGSVTTCPLEMIVDVSPPPGLLTTTTMSASASFSP